MGALWVCECGGGGRGEGFAERINILDSEDVIEDGVFTVQVEFSPHVLLASHVRRTLINIGHILCERERAHTNASNSKIRWDLCLKT